MPLDYMRRAGITLYNNRGCYSAPIAEFVLWGVLDLYKAGAFFRTNAQNHIWRQTRSLRELSGNILSAIPEVKNKSRDDVLRLLDQRLRQIHI